MKKLEIIAVSFLLAIVLSAGLADAQADRLDSAYNDCISRKIAQCEAKAFLTDSQSPSLREYAEMNRNQAQFYRVNRNQLVKEMAIEHLADNRHRIEYFLIKAYHDDQRDSLYTAK